MCIQWTCVLYSVVITRQSNPPISQFRRPCNEFTSVWPVFTYNTHTNIQVRPFHVLDYFILKGGFISGIALTRTVGIAL